MHANGKSIALQKCRGTDKWQWGVAGMAQNLNAAERLKLTRGRYKDRKCPEVALLQGAV